MQEKVSQKVAVVNGRKQNEGWSFVKDLHCSSVVARYTYYGMKLLHFVVFCDSYKIYTQVVAKT